jgi:hypothetical protein
VVHAACISQFVDGRLLLMWCAGCLSFFSVQPPGLGSDPAMFPWMGLHSLVLVC